MKAVEVEWEDSCIYRGWHSTHPTYTTEACKTVGYLISKDNKRVVIGPTTGEDNSLSDPLVIPRGCIKKIRYLK